MRGEEGYPMEMDSGAYGMPWKQPTEIDKTLLLPRASSKKMKISIPCYEKKTVAVIMQKKNGLPFKTKDGKKIYRMMEADIMSGFETKEVELPGNEIYNVDITSSYISHEEAVALRSLISLYSDIQLKVMLGKEWMEDLYYVYNRIMGMVDTAKSRDGKTARLSKTSISEGTSKQQVIEEYRKDMQKSSWRPGRM